MFIEDRHSAEICGSKEPILPYISDNYFDDTPIIGNVIARNEDLPERSGPSVHIPHHACH